MKYYREYHLDGYSLEEIARNHHKAVAERTNNALEDVTPKYNTVGTWIEKYKRLIHTIIKKNIHSGCAIMNAEIMRGKKAYGNAYVDMMYNLEMLGIIMIDRTYIPGKESMKYYLCDGISYHVEKVLSKQGLDDNELLRIENENRIKSLLPTKFYNRYTSSLKALKLTYPKQARAYVEKFKYPTVDAMNCRLDKIEELVNNEGKLMIDEVDSNDRIYHALTNCSRDLKPFLNISFACDCKNSHPLLFNLTIIKHFRIDEKTLDAIYKVFEQPIHLQASNIKKILVTDGVSKKAIKAIPADALFYIYLTSTGKFWNYILDKQKESSFDNDIVVTRSDIKLEMFGQVFYRKGLNNVTRKSTGKKKYPLASIFQDEFPTVNKLVRTEKKKDSNPKDRKELPSNMMKIESVIYREILNEIYKLNPKYRVFNIHDAIEVVDVPENSTLTIDVVKAIMTKVYRKYLLMPTLSEDMPVDIDWLMEDLTHMNQLIEIKARAIKLSASNGTSKSIVIQTALELGYLEYIWNESHNDVVLHLTDKLKKDNSKRKKAKSQNGNKQHFKQILFVINGEDIITMKGWIDMLRCDECSYTETWNGFLDDWNVIKLKESDNTRYPFMVELRDGMNLVSRWRVLGHKGRTNIYRI